MKNENNYLVEELGSATAQISSGRDEHRGPYSSIHLNDARVIGDYNSPECQIVLDSTFVSGASQGAPRVPSDKWERFELPWRDALGMLAQHPVQKEKEGLALFYYDTEQTGNIRIENGCRKVFVHRTKNATKAVTAFVIDIDGTDTVDRVRDILFKLGFFAIIYTTHSYARKSTPDGEYFRVIIPLEEPFRVSEHGGTVRRASDAWLSRYIGFCEVLGIKNPDASAAKFAQMMYTPRRPSEDAEFRHYLIAGRALKLDDMPSADISHIRKGSGRVSSARQGAGSGEHSPAFLQNGFDLKAWHKDWGEHFDLEFFLETIGWHIRNPNANGGMGILCPNHPEHSEPDDGEDEACWACQEYDGKGFVITCLHDHCGTLCTWDFLRLIEEGLTSGDAMLPDEFGCLSDALISPLMYPELVGEKQS